MADTITAKANVGAGTETFVVDNIGSDKAAATKILLGSDGVDDGFVSASNPVPVAISNPSTAVAFGPITLANTPLFTAIDTAGEASIQLQLTGTFSRGGVYFEASNDGSEYHAVLATTREDEILVETVFAPDLVTIPVTAKFFRAVTTPDFAGSVSGLYVLRATDAPTPFTQTKLVDVDPSLMFPIAGVTPAGYLTRIRVADNGGVAPADGMTIVGSRQGASVGPIFQIDTTGYGSIALQLANTFTGTVTFQTSNDGSTWSSTLAWPTAGAAVPVTTATAVGQWIIPANGKFFRAQITTGGTGVVAAIAVLKNATMPYSALTPSVTIGANSAVNVAQIAGTNTVTGGVAGIQAVGGNIAVGAAPTANPIPVGGWDGTNTRRILTDAISGGIVLGTTGASNGVTPGTLIAAGTNNLTQIKGTVGKLHFFHVRSKAASARYVKLFNLPSASVTMGTTPATMNFEIPANGELNLPIPSLGFNMGGTGISFALVTGESLTNNTAVTASDLIVNWLFV